MSAQETAVVAFGFVAFVILLLVGVHWFVCYIKENSRDR